ncbi:transglycosylase SLT domain-containing protein [Methylobacterium amylolyticum]|uniref:transglycosylase SLT domain-containing protein n=1 Tax=Methylobacterium sp. NEAU 140 TaxID=3064945 RepID=UPI00351F98A8
MAAPPILTEEACLDAVMRLRFGDAPCRACGGHRGFQREARNRAFSCRACGLKVFPCQGTPFAKPRPRLVDWFLAVDLAARGAGGGRALRALGLDRRTAEAVAAGVERLKASADAGPTAQWFPAIAAFVAAHRPEPAAGPTPQADPDRETLWQSLRALTAGFQVERRPAAGLIGIAAFALAGAGIGWLLVPQEPEPDTELAQATAVLSLGENRPVILVTAEVAAQLYDVTDVDADPSSPLASSIRISPKPGPQGAAPGAPADRPAAPPPIKLSSGAGKSLVTGDTGAVRESARDRPELAAYSALATELEGKGPRNPDELLVFGPMRIRRYLVEKIVRASRATSVDPVLLMAIADKESSFKTEVQAATSSASGLYQFIERTWLGVVRDFGPRYGLEAEAALVAAGDLGGGQRARILDLRRDPYLSAVFAAEMLKRDSLRIARRIGRNLTGGEVYLVHFLGPDGAERMIDEVTRKPETVAAELLPKPAAANKPIFYGAGAKSLSVAEVRGKFETMISLRLDRYRSVKGVDVPNTPEARPVPPGR